MAATTVSNATPTTAAKEPGGNDGWQRVTPLGAMGLDSSVLRMVTLRLVAWNRGSAGGGAPMYLGPFTVEGGAEILKRPRGYRNAGKSWGRPPLGVQCVDVSSGSSPRHNPLACHLHCPPAGGAVSNRGERKTASGMRDVMENSPANLERRHVLP